MAVSTVGTPTTVSCSTNITSFTINVPSGVADGDELHMIVGSSSTVQPATPAGWSVWTPIITTTANAMTVFSRVASSEPASYTVSGLTSAHYNVSMAAYRGQHVTTPRDIPDVTASSISTYATPGNIGNLTANGMLVVYSTSRSASADVSTAYTSSNLTVDANAPGADGASTNPAVGVAHLALTTAGTITSPNLVASGTPTKGVAVSSVIRASGAATSGVVGAFSANSAATTSASPAFTLPAGISTGDIGVAIVTLNGVAQTLSILATGWTLSAATDNATNARTYTATKTLASTDSGTTVTWSLSGAIRWALAGCVVTGVSAIDVTAAPAQDTSLTTTMTVPGYTTTASYDLAFILAGSQRSFSTTDGEATLPSGYVPLVDVATSNASASDFGAMVAVKTLSTTAGVVAATSGTWNGASRDNVHVLALTSSSVAITPADASFLTGNNLTANATIPAADTGAGVEAATLLARPALADTGADTETVASPASVAPTETSSNLQNVTTAVAIGGLDDTGGIADAATLLVTQGFNQGVTSAETTTLAAQVGMDQAQTSVENLSETAAFAPHFNTSVNVDVHWVGGVGGDDGSGFKETFIDVEAVWTGEDTSYVFNPPAYEDADPRDEFWVRYSMPKGQSIIRVNGALVLQTIPTMDQLVGVEGQDYFLGGHVYRIGNAVAAELTQYGFHVDGFESFVGTWAGDSDQTTLYVTALTPDIALAGMKLSLAQDMSNPVVSAAVAPSATGFTKHVFTDLMPGTKYWRQAFDGSTGNMIGAPHPAWTRRAAGSSGSGITKIAAFSCRQSTPASTATAVDIVSWFGATPSVQCRTMDTGDNGYSNSMTEFPQSHEEHFAEQMADEAWYLLGDYSNRDYVGSDHDTNGTGKSNLPNGDDPITQGNILAWNSSLPFDVQDTRLRDKGRFGFREGHVAYGFPDTRCLDKTDPSDKHNPQKPDSAQSRMLGDNQMNRLLADLTDAKRSGCAVYVLFTDPAWNGTSEYPIDTAQSDKWPSFIYDRERISRFAHDTGIPLFIVHGDDHGMKQDDGTMETNGHAVIGGSPFDKQLHANYQDAVQWFYPDGVKGGGDEIDGKQRHAMMYQRLTIDDNTGNPGHVVITADARDCTPADTPGTPKPPSDCPKTVRTMVKTYVIP